MPVPSTPAILCQPGKLHGTSHSSGSLNSLTLPAPQHASAVRHAHPFRSPKFDYGAWVWVHLSGDTWIPGVIAAADFTDWKVVYTTPKLPRLDEFDAALACMIATPGMVIPYVLMGTALSVQQREAVAALQRELDILAAYHHHMRRCCKEPVAGSHRGH